MVVTDEMVDAIRVLLSGDGEEFRRLNAAIDRSDEAQRAYTALVLAAFAAAVERNFVPQVTRDTIIDYVADVRSRSSDVAEDIDPDAAERLIAMVFDDDINIDDLSNATRVRLQGLLLYALISDEGLDDAATDRFLDGARKLADEILG